VQFVVLSDGNATDFVSRVSMPIFKDSTRAQWTALRPDVVKHDTFVFDANGQLKFSWRVSDGTGFATAIGAAVRALP
jgi:hypothetical protein